MKTINDFLNYKSSINEVVRSDELEKIAYQIINELDLKEFAQSVVITDFNRSKIFTNSFAFYDGTNIYFDYLRTFYLIVNTAPDSISSNLLSDYANLKLLSILLHEIYHVVQKRKITLDPKKTESIILKYSHEKKKNLLKEKRYISKFYETNPLERQARIKSLKKILCFAKSNNDIVSGILFDLNLQVLNGYDRNNPLSINPCNTYFEQNMSFVDTNNELSYEKKLELGLPVKSI